MNKSTTALALVLIASASPALVQASWTFSDVDVDGTDAVLSDEIGTEVVEEVEAVDLDVDEVGAGARETEIISLDEWVYDDLYAAGISADEVIEEMNVYGVAGEEIGEVEDLIVRTEGRILAVIAEVGGFLDMGDAHVSVPWGEVEIADDGDAVILPLTDETIEDYGIFDAEWITAEEAATEVIGEAEDAETGPRAWRVSELMGDYVRLPGEEPYRNYGYANDVILSDGEVAAVVVEPSFEYGGGYRAYPYYGYCYG